ncbi:MAG: ATP-binding protein [bacterium]
MKKTLVEILNNKNKKIRILIFFVLYFCYWFFFPQIFSKLGESSGLVSTVIIALFGYFYGKTFGLGSALFFFPLNFFLYSKMPTTTDFSIYTVVFRQGSSFAIGYFTGSLRSLIDKNKTQAALLEEEGEILNSEVENRKTIEKKLIVLSNNLESIVEERTTELKKTNKHLLEEINKRKFVQNKLENHINFEQLISSISKRIFYFKNNIEEDISFILEQIGIYTNCDHCYVYRLSSDKKNLINTHFWSKDNTHLSGKVHNIFLDRFLWFKDILNYSGNVFIKNINELPVEAYSEKDFFIKRSIKSFIAVPFYYDENLDGFIGLDYVTDTSFYGDEELNLLVTVSELFSVVLKNNTIEKQLQDNEQYLKLLLDSIHTGIVIIDAETHTIIEVNEYTTKMFGVSKDEMIGKLCHQYICPVNQGDCPITDLGYKVDLSEKIMIDSFNNRIPILKSVIQANRNNKPILIESFTDIGNLKKTEIALRESEEKLKIIFNSLSDVVYSLNKDFIIVSINSSVERILDYKVSSILGKNITKLGILTPDSLYKAVDYANRIFAGEILPSVTLEFIARDGSIRIGEVNSTLANLNSEPINISVARDITERIDTEKRLNLVNSQLISLNNKLNISTKQLSELNASKDKFFSIISHDLRSPFMGLLGLSDLLKTDYNNLIDSERVFIFDSINNSIKKIYNLLDNLLQWSKIQTGRVQYNPQKVTLKNIVIKTTELLQANIYQKNISLNIAFDDTVLVYADIISLESVFQNLISNAIKFTYPYGKISINVVKLDDMIQIEISDSGIGINESEITKLFKIDEQFTTHGTNEEVGSGLGLILCKEHILKNGGKIWVKSKVGAGTTFYFTLKNAEFINQSN